MQDSGSRGAEQAFYLPEGEELIATELTRGPWDRGAQHAGPPSALLGRAIERVDARRGMRIARITVEIFRSIPISTLRVSARVVRPGRSVELCEAELSGPDGVLARARAWRIRTAQVALPPGTAGSVEGEPLRPSEEGRKSAWSPSVEEFGYFTAIDWRFVRGDIAVPGPATVWTRMRHPLVAGEEPSPLTRLLVVADSANGVSSVLDWDRWAFINPDLTVLVHRLPEGEWVCLDARSTVEPDGTGMAASTLSDRRGPVARGLQSLLITPR